MCYGYRLLNCIVYLEYFFNYFRYYFKEYLKHGCSLIITFIQGRSSRFIIVSSRPVPIKMYDNKLFRIIFMYRKMHLKFKYILFGYFTRYTSRAFFLNKAIMTFTRLSVKHRLTQNFSYIFTPMKTFF